MTQNYRLTFHSSSFLWRISTNLVWCTKNRLSSGEYFKNHNKSFIVKAFANQWNI